MINKSYQQTRQKNSGRNEQQKLNGGKLNIYNPVAFGMRETVLDVQYTSLFLFLFTTLE